MPYVYTLTLFHVSLFLAPSNLLLSLHSSAILHPYFLHTLILLPLSFYKTSYFSLSHTLDILIKSVSHLLHLYSYTLNTLYLLLPLLLVSSIFLSLSSTYSFLLLTL